MNTAYRYAREQLLGMSFEPFSYRSPEGKTYYWNNPAAKLICRFLLFFGLEGACEWVFTHSVEVE